MSSCLPFLLATPRGFCDMPYFVGHGMYTLCTYIHCAPPKSVLKEFHPNKLRLSYAVLERWLSSLEHLLCGSCRGHRFYSQHPLGSSQLPLTSDPRAPVPSSALQEPAMHTVHRYTNKQSTCETAGMVACTVTPLRRREIHVDLWCCDQPGTVGKFRPGRNPISQNKMDDRPQRST